MQLSYPPKGVQRRTTGRAMRKKTFQEKGLDYASEVSLKNARDLHHIMTWNVLNGYKFFRIGSDLFPWASEYKISELKDIEQIKQWLHSAGVMAKTHGIRLTSHPGPFNVLVSPHQHVVEKCVVDLSIHGELFDMIGLSRTPYNKINIHLGGAYGDKESAMDRFCKNFELLPESVSSRLTVENDDKESMYSVKDLYYGIYNRIGVPIVFDYHHHRFCDGGLSEQDALELAISTWPEGITPATHYSESRSIEQEDDKIRPQAHSDYVYDKIETYGNEIDIMVEAKKKELAVAKYLELHG
jgi:UV DNA damage endonuclease